MLRCDCRACPQCGRGLEFPPAVSEGVTHVCSAAGGGCGQEWGHLTMDAARQIVAFGVAWDVDGGLVDVFRAAVQQGKAREELVPVIA